MTTPEDDEERFRTHVFEAKTYKWMRNVFTLGVLAAAETINAYSEVTPREHLAIGGGGIALAGAVCYLLDREKRRSAVMARVEQDLENVSASINHREPAEWASERIPIRLLERRT